MAAPMVATRTTSAAAAATRPSSGVSKRASAHGDALMSASVASTSDPKRVPRSAETSVGEGITVQKAGGGTSGTDGDHAGEHVAQHVGGEGLGDEEARARAFGGTAHLGARLGGDEAEHARESLRAQGLQ